MDFREPAKAYASPRYLVGIEPYALRTPVRACYSSHAPSVVARIAPDLTAGTDTAFG